MSMQSWTVTGFGIREIAFDDASTDNKIRFIKKFLPKIYKEMQDDCEGDGDIDMNDTSDYLYFCEEWIANYEDDYGNMGFAAIFADAINENEEDFDVVYANGVYPNESSVLYEDRMPWEMSDRVKSMTCDDMRDVFKKYLDVLEITTDISRQSVENYG